MTREDGGRKETPGPFPIIVTGDPVTRITTRFAPLENSTQKCAAKTPLTRRESFIDRRRRTPPLFVFSSASSHLLPLISHPLHSRGTILIESFSSPYFPPLSSLFRSLCRGSLSRGEEKGEEGTNTRLVFDFLKILGDRLDRPDSNFEVIS